MGLHSSRQPGSGSMQIGIYHTKYRSRIFQMRSLLRGQRCDERCYPSMPYKPYPTPSPHELAADGLLLKFRALPEMLITCDLPSETYWWVDAQFLSYNDRQLVVTSTAYVPRANFPWLPVSDLPAGRIMLYSISSSPIELESFVRTKTRSYPKVQPHPLGNLVGYVQCGETQILNLNNETVYSQPLDLMTGPYRFMAIAPNGIGLAMISRGQGFYHVKVAQMDVSFRKAEQARCHRLCPGFVACRTFTDHVECKWSPDSKHLGVSSSLGRMFVVGASLSPSDVVVVCPDLIGDDISNAGCFAFDPRFDHQVIAIGGRGSCLVYIVDLDSKTVIFHIPETGGKDLGVVGKNLRSGGSYNGVGETGLEELNMRVGGEERVMGGVREDPEVGEKESVDCVAYSPSGSILAVAYHNLVIEIYSTCNRATIHTVDMRDSWPDLAQRLPSPRFPAVQRLAFSRSESLLMATTCDGFVSLWSVPTNFTLRHLCKLQILAMLPVQHIHKLCLPTTVKNFLLS